MCIKHVEKMTVKKERKKEKNTWMREKVKEN